MRKTSSSVKLFESSSVQLAGRLEIVTERLLDDQSDPAFGRAALADLLDELRHRIRRDGEVVDAIPARAELLVEVVESQRMTWSWPSSSANSIET